MSQLADHTEAYAAYLNGRQRFADEARYEELEEYDEDLAKAKAAMEVAWLDQLAT